VDKPIEWLDRQKISCNEGEALQRFQLTKSGCGGDEMRFDHTCVSIEGHSLSYDTNTGCNEFTGKRLELIDRHNLACTDEEYMEGFWVTDSGCRGSGNKKFWVKCALTTTTTTIATTTTTSTTTTTTTTTITTTTTEDDASALDDPHLSDMGGDRFDLYNEGKQEFVVIPAGASSKDADLLVTGTVEKYGERENDLWIRRLNVKGRWVDGETYNFKTNSASFGDEATIQVRAGKGNKWTSLDKVKDSNLLVTSKDKRAPTTDFAESVAKVVQVQAGPLKVVVSFATAQKEGEKVNHLDLHVKNLHSVKSEVGGLLAGELSAF